MAHKPVSERARAASKPRREHHLPVGVLGLLEMVVLGTLAAVLTLWAFPALYGIEWECFADTGGVVPRTGDHYESGVVVFGTIGWLLVAIGVLYARIFESRRGTLLLPAAWFVVFVLGAFVIATALGSQPCPA